MNVRNTGLRNKIYQEFIVGMLEEKIRDFLGFLFSPFFPPFSLQTSPSHVRSWSYD